MIEFRGLFAVKLLIPIAKKSVVNCMDEHIEESTEKYWDGLQTAVDQLSTGVEGLDNIESNTSSITMDLEKNIHGE